MGSFVDRALDFIFGVKPRVQRVLLPKKKVLKKKILHLSNGSAVRFEFRRSADGGVTPYIRCNARCERVHVSLDDGEAQRFHKFCGQFAKTPGCVKGLEDYNRQHSFQLIRGAKPIRMQTQERGKEPVFCFFFAFEAPHVYELDAGQCADVSAFLSNYEAIGKIH